MFAITEAEAAAIRTVFEERDELSAVVELRRFPGVTDNVQARECVRNHRRLAAAATVGGEAGAAVTAAEAQRFAASPVCVAAAAMSFA